MNNPRVSVCIVSWNRPAALRRCLLGIGQLLYPEFEIVVAADKFSLDSLDDTTLIKRVQVTEPNISLARNLAISQAAGDVVAFIDDDAVPEAAWLNHLTKPFADPDVAAVGGYVRGRNGISWQWRGRIVNTLGETQPYQPGADIPPGWAIKTEGTNMAFRADALRQIGGFDPAFRYFLDETDVYLRLASKRYQTAIVPDAEVHHGFHEGPHRRPDRVPRDLFEIGASWAVFLRKHNPESSSKRLVAIRESENTRLIRYLIGGALEPRDVRRIRASLLAGMDEGAQRTFDEPQPFTEPTGFFPYKRRVGDHVVHVCRPMSYARTWRKAAEHVQAGGRTTIFNLSATTLFHNIQFTKDGIWEHRGGLFGKSERTDPLMRIWTRSQRVARELDRVRIARGIAS